MEPVRNVSSGDLSSKARQLLEAVHRGDTILLEEEEGRAEAALMDIVDYRILRAVMHFLAADPNGEGQGEGLRESELAEANDQERYNLILARYLGGAISLSRTAELLDVAPSVLRSRFDQLNVPQRTAPSGLEEARSDVQTALNWPSAAS